MSLYSPPLYQLSYQRISVLQLRLDLLDRAGAWPRPTLGVATFTSLHRSLREPAPLKHRPSTRNDIGYPTTPSPLVAQLVERWTVAGTTGIHRSLVQIRPGGRFAIIHEVLTLTIYIVIYTFSHCESASVHLRSADCIGVVSWDTTPAKVASYRHSAPL